MVDEAEHVAQGKFRENGFLLWIPSWIFCPLPLQHPLTPPVVVILLFRIGVVDTLY